MRQDNLAPRVQVHFWARVWNALACGTYHAPFLPLGRRHNGPVSAGGRVGSEVLAMIFLNDF